MTRDDVAVPEESSTRPAALGRPTPAVSGDRLYVNLTSTSDGGKVVSLDRATGEERWSHSFKRDYVYPPAVKDQLLAVASGLGELKLLTKTGGIVDWQKDFDSKVYAPPAFDGEIIAIVVSPTFDDNRCLAIDASTGDTRWEFPFDDPSGTTPGGVGIADGVVFATTHTGGSTGKAVALEYESGLTAFSSDIGAPGHSTPTPIDGGVVVPDGPQARCLSSDTPGTSTTTKDDESSNGEGTRTLSSTDSDPPTTQEPGATEGPTNSDGSQGVFGGENTLTIISIIVTAIGALIGLVELIKRN